MEFTEEMPVPPHLQSLFEAATTKCSKAEWKAINQLLNSFWDMISKDEFDLGKTHLVEHLIETGYAAPVKLLLRCISLAFADVRPYGVREAEKERSYPTLNISLGSTLGYGTEVVWSTKNVPGLLVVKCSNKGCGIPNTLYPGLVGCSSRSNYFSTMGYNSSLS